ncbi:hypothetical protein [Nocardia wallacei]|uniref:hypothetical protein n=1 Tax=Nocardia wallacei TaxID=480035 RepID=UPI00245658F1|nr:hypothetical protein [Nocardia wallacei]
MASHDFDDDEDYTPPSGVYEAAVGGDRRELMVALRDRLARAVEDSETPPRDLASLSRRLLEVAREIEAIDADDTEDDLTKAASTPDDEWDPEAV